MTTWWHIETPDGHLDVQADAVEVHHQSGHLAAWRGEAVVLFLAAGAWKVAVRKVEALP